MIAHKLAAAVASGATAAHDEWETDVSESGEGTTFMQWRERTQTESKEGEPQLRAVLITAAIVVLVGIVLGVVVLLMS